VSTLRPRCRPCTLAGAWLAITLVGCGSDPEPPDAASETEATSDDASGEDTDAPDPATSGSATTSGSASTSADPDGGETSADSTGDDASTGEDLPPAGRPAFIAQGHMGRTMLSCDDGHTWVANQSLDDATRCFEGIDCDHHEGAGTGLSVSDDTLIVATWGWGTEGRILTSPDGVDWTEVLVGPTFAGSAFGNDTFIAAARVPWRAGATGDDWVELPDSGLDEWNARGTGFLPHDGGLFIIGGGGAESSDIVLSSNDGDDWWHPDAFPAGCGTSIRGIAYGAGTIVIARGADDGADLCVSSDGGVQFQAIDLEQTPSGPPMWTGDELVVFSSQMRFTSADGTTWAGEAISPAEVRIGAVARSPDGTYVAHRAGWMVWYEQQRMYRSDDGLTWEILPEGAFVGSHPIRSLRFGYVQPHADGCSE